MFCAKTYLCKLILRRLEYGHIGAASKASRYLLQTIASNVDLVEFHVSVDVRKCVQLVPEGIDDFIQQIHTYRMVKKS